MKRIKSAALIFLMGLILCSCGNTSSDESGYKVYYVLSDKTGIGGVSYDYNNDSLAQMVNEALNMLSQSPENIDYINTIPSKVEVDRWENNDGSLILYLRGDYAELDIYTEILVRAAMVKTLVQIDGVDYVTIYVNDKPLADSNGDLVGAMTADTFIEDFGQETDSLLYTELTLYFASADGMSLVPETREVYYSRNVSLERVAIEQLIMGPKEEGLVASLPAGCKVNSVSLSENGVCIINFDSSIEAAVTGVTENVTVYSIVDSLTELDGVNQVQLLVNGDSPHISNVDVDLSEAISRNESIINEAREEDGEYLGEEYTEGDFEAEDIDIENQETKP